jgi:DNA invertase Pin-like site-specific DNA recombinase
MSIRAALYTRSSKDRNDVSLDSQRRALHELAQAKGLVVIEEYADAVESGKDEDRPAFQSLLRALKRPDRGWENVLVLDTSRIARRRHIALIFEHECDKAGIRIHYKAVPDSDPITGMLLKSILQAMDEWHSLTSKAKGLAGMAENVRQGWRAGGRAPRGYKLDYHATGAIRDGTPVLKSKLIPGDDAEVVRAYLKGRAAGESRGTMLMRLDLDWPVDSLNPMEWQALTYAGHTAWNVHNEQTAEGYKTGEKRKPRAEWLITKNTHPPLITDEEAEAILAQLDRQKLRRTRATDRPYLLTGFLMTPDDQQWHGEWCSRMDAALYRVGKGKKISARRVDQAILARLLVDLQSEESIGHITATLKGIVAEPVDGRRIAGLEKKLETATRKVGKLVDMLVEAEGAAAEAYKRTISQTEIERAGLIEELSDLRQKVNQREAAQSFTDDDARRLMRLLFAQLQEGIDAGEIQTIKAALGGLIERITLCPVSDKCTINYRIAPTDTGVIVASPRDSKSNPVKWTAEVSILQKRAA